MCPIEAQGLSRRERRTRVWGRFMVEFRRHSLPTMELTTTFPRFCLPARPLQRRQEEHRGGRTTAQGFGRSLLALPFADARLRRTAL